MLRFVYLLASLTLVVLAACVSGCASRDCHFSLIGTAGPRTAIVIDSCTGDITLRNIPENPVVDSPAAHPKSPREADI